MVKTFDLKIIKEKSQLAFFPTMAVVEILDNRQLAHFKPFLETLKHVQHIEGVIVVTDSNPINNEIAAFCKEDSLHLVRGKEQDPLAWFYAAGVSFDLEVFIRVTSHSLKVHPEQIEKALFCFRQNYDKLDYLSSSPKNSGHALEIFRFSALQEAFFHATGDERKEVTSYITKHPRHFRLGTF